MMFLSINYVGFNKIVYLFLERLDGFQDYFTELSFASSILPHALGPAHLT